MGTFPDIGATHLFTLAEAHAISVSRQIALVPYTRMRLVHLNEFIGPQARMVMLQLGLELTLHLHRQVT